MRALVLAAALTFASDAAELKPKTLEAFDQYVRETETRRAADTSLWADQSPDRLRRIRAGEVVVSPFRAKSEVKVPYGRIHDCVGSVFIPNLTVDRLLAMVEDYNNHKNIYKPEVVDSKLLSRNGNDFHIYLRLLKKKVITVQLNTEHDVRYTQLDPKHWRSASRTTRIAEVENPGKKDEREKAPGTGEGFLWRLNSYWDFLERDGGVYLECEAISLTRDVPTGLGWLIEPIIRNLPQESLANTLKSTRTALTLRQ